MAEILVGAANIMRRYPDSSGNLSLAEGDYGKDGAGVWQVRPPGQHAGSIPYHEVTENEDDTITVVPSIVLRDETGKELWHGRLTRGEWRTSGP